MRLLAIAASVLLAASAAADDPFELTSKDGRFSAAFPADPVKSSRDVELKNGLGKITVISYVAEEKRRSFNIAYNDYPRAVVAAKAQDVLKNVRDGNLGDGVLGDEKTGTFGPRKLPMRSYTYTRDKLHYRNLIVLDDVRLYQVLIVAETEAALSDEAAEAFYKAFKITGGPAAVPGKPREAFVNKIGRFSVAFPGEPKEQKNTVPIMGSDKKITVINHVVEVSKTVAFLVAHSDYPDGVISPDPQDLLQGVRDGNLGPEGKLIEEKKGTFGPKKFAMREFTFTKDGHQFRNRLILDGNRLYQVMIVADDASSLTNDSAKSFYDSFKILPLED